MKKEKLFTGKVAWITGASSGIGEALVHEFVRSGATVIASSNDLTGLERVKTECGDKSMMVHCVPFDLADTSGIDKIVEQQINKLKRIDFLLNIGGISQRARIDETPIWLDRKIFEINYFGTIALTKAVLPFMVKQKSGHILATSSIS
jgi:dehydrogenase/reductase SDR family member 7B